MHAGKRVFTRINERESLTDIEVCLRAQHSKL